MKDRRAAEHGLCGAGRQWDVGGERSLGPQAFIPWMSSACTLRPCLAGSSYVPRPSVWLWALKWEPWVQMGFKPNMIASTHLSQPRQWIESPCRWGQE